MNCAHLFFNTAKRFPHKTALIDQKSSISYLSLESNIKKKAHYLSQRGIKKGDRILIFIPMSIQLYQTVLACFMLGAIPVFVDDWSSKARLRQCIQSANCKGVISSSKILLIGRLFSFFNQIDIKVNSNKSSSIEFPEAMDVDKNDQALITFTTGTTGKPKAAIRTHGLLHAQYDALKNEINPSPSQVDLCNLPIVILLNLATGSTTYIPSIKNKQAQVTPDLIRKFKINSFTGSPSVTESIAELLVNRNTKNLMIEKITVGGAAVFPHSVKNWQDRFPNAAIQIVYGSTECEPISSISARKLLSFENSISSSGLPVGEINQNVSIKIIAYRDRPINEKEFRSLELTHGEKGEIIVTGPHALKAYVNNPEAEARNKIDIDGTRWHRTGDLGLITAEGKLFLHGRCESLSDSKPTTYSPFIIEGMLGAIDGVKKGCLVSVNNNWIGVIEATKERTFHAIDQSKRMFPDIPNWKVIPKIPVDHRHQSRIDYNSLKKMV